MKDKLFLWLDAFRARSFSAALVPMALGASIAYYRGYEINLPLLMLVIAAGILVHGAGNLTNDYFDFKKGFDKNDSFGKGHVLTEGRMSSSRMLKAIIISFGLAFLLGLILVLIRGPLMLFLGLAGMAGAYFYTGRPFCLKDIGAGDLLIFIVMGPLMVFGTFFALTGQIAFEPVLISLPVGFLVTAILNSNNLRDFEHDLKSGIRTFAAVIGKKAARIEYISLILSSYALIVIFTLKGTLPVVSLIVLISLPLAISAITNVFSRSKNSISLIDVKTAQLQLVFGILLSISLILSR